MCNANNHSAGCNCGFGPRTMGAAMAAAGLSAPFAKITSDVLGKMFPIPKFGDKPQQFGNKLYDKTLKDKKLTEQQKKETMAYMEQLTDKAIKTVSDGLWAGFQTVQAASKGLRENVVLGKLADAYSSVLTDALPLDAMYGNKLFWDVVYGNKERSSEEWKTINKYKAQRAEALQGKDDPYDILVSSPFGPRILNGKKFHDGVDINTIGTAGVITHAPQAGKVLDTSYNKKAGNLVHFVVRADDGSACFIQTCHHNKTFVKAGDVLEPGQPIAEVSDVGETTGVHLDLKTGYVDKPPEASVEVKMKKGFNPAGLKGVSYKNGTLTVKGEAAKAYKDKLAAQAEDKAAVEGLFTDFKTRKYTYDEIIKMSPAEVKKISWQENVQKRDPYTGELSKQLVPTVIRDMKRQIVAKKVAEEIAARQKNLLKAKPKQETKPKAAETIAGKPRKFVPKPTQAPAHVGH